MAGYDARALGFARSLGVVNAALYGVFPGAAMANNTAKLQALIDGIWESGRTGSIFLPNIGTGVYTFAASTSLELSVHSGNAFSTFACIILRDGVTLILDSGVKVLAGVDGRTVITAVDIEVGACITSNGRAFIGKETPGGSTGHGINSTNIAADGVDPRDLPIQNLTISHIEIGNVGGYGIGLNRGYFKNVNIFDVYIHDTGSDGIDIKARPKSDGTPPMANLMANIRVERFGLTDDDTAGIDVRGLWQVDGVWVYDFRGTNSKGIRCNAGTGSAGNDQRQSSEHSILTNFHVDSFHPLDTNFIGVQFQSSGLSSIGAGTVKDCYTGLNFGSSGTGWGSARQITTQGITIEGSNTALVSSSLGASLGGITVRGRVDTFSPDAEGTHLETPAGSTLTLPREHDVSTLQVYVNGTLKAGGGVDYTINSATEIAFTTSLAGTETVDVVTPTVNGIRVSTPDHCIIAPTFEYVTNEIVFDETEDEATCTVVRTNGINRLVDRLHVGSGSIDDFGSTHPYLLIARHASITDGNPGGELILGHGATITTGNILGALSFYSSDPSSAATGRQAAIKGICDESSGRSAGLGFFAGTGTEGAAVEAMRIASNRRVGIGEAVPDYKLDVNGSLGFTPGSSVTPVDNGDVVFEFTNNTTLTIRAKGTDGTVRSGTVTLA